MVLAVWTLWLRELVRFYRDRHRMIGAFGQPLLFWLLIGSGFGGSFRAGGGTYLEYLYPGTLMLVLLFTAIFSTISIVEDRREGFLQSVLVSPIPRSGLVLGKVLGGTTMALLQGVIFLILAAVLGVSLRPAGAVCALGPIFLVAFGMTGLGFCIAWRMTSTAGFHAIMNVFLMPLWLLSGAFFPRSGAPAWLGFAMAVNPLTYGMSALRQTLYPGLQAEGLPSLSLSLAVTAAFAGLMFFISMVSVRRRLTADG
ncbi:MAG: multidrug ABC transporter permease [Candidatus Latescibacteria bacterium]|nr:multidrug ABC transporter permease [Candidatus Latescibacterota bacterium]